MTIRAAGVVRAVLLGSLVALGQVGLASAESPSVAPAPSGLRSPTGSETLSVMPSLVAVDVRPGGSATAELTLRAAVPLDVTLVPQGLRQGTNGSFASLSQDQDSSPYSARLMVAVAPGSLRLEPGAAQTVAVTISVPEDVGEGTRYAIIAITGRPAGSSENVGIGVELGVTTLVGLTGTAQTRTGSISDLKLGASLPGQPLPVIATLTNTGNTHYGNAPVALTTTATLQDAAGNLVGSAEEILSGNSIVPAFSRELPLTLALAKPLAPGRYHLETGAGLQDGTVLDRKALDFDWTGGEILGATSAPAQGPPPATGVGSTDTLALIVAGVVGAAVAILVFALVLRPRRPRRGVSGEGTGG